MNKFIALVFTLFLTACGGANYLQASNPFQQGIGRKLPAHGLAVEPKDPFAQVMERKEK